MVRIRKPVVDLAAGDVVTAFVWPRGRRLVVRGGPFEVASIELTDGEWEGVPQVRIVSASRTRADRYSNGATHAEVQ